MQSIQRKTVLLLPLMAVMLALAACQTGGQTGALAGAGIGALAGQAIGGDTGATLIGAAVGSGIGYMIGNEQDKKHAREMSQAQRNPTHTEVGLLGGTRWTVVSLTPRDVADEYVSRVIEFRSNGRVITTTTNPDGSVEVRDETYRVVGDTLIINKPGYLVNARFNLSGDQLIVSAEDFSAVLRRVR